MTKNLRPHEFKRVTPEKFNRVSWLVLAGLTALAVAMRFYRLGDFPDGLHYDEALNGLDALSLASIPLTDWPMFFDQNNGREPLFIWLSSIVHVLFGPSMWAVRFISACSGVLLVPALAWLAWQVAPFLSVRNRQLFALWCATAFLGLLWGQMSARIGVRANLFVLLETVLLAVMWKNWQHKPPALITWILTGTLMGLSFYSYLPARLLPLIFVLLLGTVWLQERPRVSGHLPGLLCSLVVALLIVSPLGIYFLQNPLSFSTRIGQVTTGIARQDVFDNLGAVLGMFLFSGDASSIFNLPSRPVLDPFLALPFLIGLGLALQKFWELGRLFLLAGLGVMLLPTVLSDHAPHFLRAIGALPFTALLIAYGAESLAGYAALFQEGRLYRPALAVGWVILCGAIALTGWTYFGVLNSSARMFYAWTVGYSQIARYIDDANETRVYISPRDANSPYTGARPHPSADYLLMVRGITPQYHDERTCLRVALKDSAQYFSLVRMADPHPLRLDSYFPDTTPPRPTVFDNSGKYWATEFRKEEGEPVVFPEMRPFHAKLADGIDLHGYRLAPENLQPEQLLNVRFFWHVKRTPSQDYTLFLHLLHANEEGFFEQLAGFDHPPGNGACPMTEWLPGEMIVHEAELLVPTNLPLGDLFLAVGFYTPSNGWRMPVSLSADDHVLIGPLPQ